jgi:hypothetical protein
VATTTEARAQASRTWVSGTGDDLNLCSREAPCKTFASALSKTAAGGEINVVDPGSFGAVTINKSITINGDGTFAGIFNNGLTGVIVNAGADDHVVLRNLSIQGGGTGISGIRFLRGRHLTVDNVAISGFTARGIDVSVSANDGSVVGIDLRNVRITKGANAASTPVGVFVSLSPGPGLALATLDHVTLTGLNNGLEVALNGRAMVSNSVISGNQQHGVLARHATAVINVEGSQIDFNELVGVNSSVSGATIRLANNEIYNNSNGVTFAAGATVSSAGDNRVAGNTGSAPPNGGAIPLQ